MSWKRKLTSRKFWVCIIGFVTALLVAFNVGQGSIEQICSIVSAFGVLVTYMFSEAYADANGEGESDENK